MVDLTKMHILLFKNKISKSKLAEIIGKTRQTVYSKLQGKRKFTVEELNRLAKHLKISLKDLMLQLM
ncbi:MAG TPA: helix-turn-helix transcriptional regulator [Gallicola sp.]|nr:helix-turn-helix transcriptional regulator [Gallicola sp.]